ncbi:MAG: hypothetical protein FVQ80_06890 [Planctomycetes bacterium]|nr:hypothetical protein [Planctomycetota bacterium]
MSVIVAGKSCSKCKKKYWVSFGHPKWYSTWIKNKREENPPEFKAWKELGSLGKCPLCADSDWKRLGRVLLRGWDII